MHNRRLIDVILIVIMAVILVWWRAHTFAPRVDQLIGLKFWPQMSGSAEPLDCDEAAYGYMGRRMAAGAVLYMDLTEYKPPAGYWFYAISIAVLGWSELTIRFMILPVLILTLLLVGSVARKLAGTVGSVAAMAVFILMSTDPYVFGNGSNLEHLMNMAGMSALWCFLKAYDANQFLTTSTTDSDEVRNRKLNWRDFWLLSAGLFIGLAATVKQVALIGLFPIVFEFVRSKSMPGRKLFGMGMCVAGFAVPWAIAVAILAVQGGLADARADVFEYSRALARDTPADPVAPSFAYRWLTGNADPRNGSLPWPFGKTDWLVWWGTGAWPLHAIASIVFLASLKFSPVRATPVTRLVLWQYPVAWGMIILPGLYWQHYYLLLAPVSSIFVGVALGYAFQWSHLGETEEEIAAKTAGRKPLIVLQEDHHLREILSTSLMLAIGLVVGLTGRIQWYDYFNVPADMLTVKYKGGAQWITLRQLGREIKDRTIDWNPKPMLEVWGWQSPLLYYSGLDAPDRYFFTDPLAKAFIGKEHPQVSPRIERLTESLKSKRPELIFCGDIPFRELKAMIDRDYIATSLVGSTPDGRGMFVRKDKYQDFHARIKRPTGRAPAAR
ncbi:hypothetical protein GC170_14070 [bacterium]|nr:hypothetical protein [bacterium]